MAKKLKSRNEKITAFSYVTLLGENANTSIIEVLKVGMIYGHNVKITATMLSDFVKNFDENIYGNEIAINLNHDRGGPSAGWVKRLFEENGLLLAEVEWTSMGKEKILNKEFKFTSSELLLNFAHPDTGQKYANVFGGIALTNTPAVKGMQAITLSEKAQNFITKNNMEELNTMFKELMLQEKISDADLKKFEEAAEEAKTEETTEDVEKMEKVVDEKAKEEEEVKDEGKEDGEGEKKEEPKKEDEVKLKAKEKVVSLSDFKALNDKTLKLQEQLDMKCLNEEVTNELLLSENTMTGFAKDQLEDVVGFMISLTEKQRAEFKTLVAKVSNVNLSEIGSSSSAKKIIALSEDAVVELADELFKKAKDSGKEITMEEAQKKATNKLSSK